MGYALRPDEPICEMQLAFATLFARQFPDALRHFEVRFKYKLHSYLSFPYPKWKGEPGKTVYLVADQGLGDTLSYARFVPALCNRAQYVHAIIQPELLRLFTDIFVGIPNLNLIPAPQPFPAADAWTTFVSLPGNLEMSEDELRNTPFPAIRPMFAPTNWKVPGRKLHIGIAWGGSMLNDINKHRSIPIDFFGDLFSVPGVQLYSLQVGQQNQEMYDAGYAPLIRDLTQYISGVDSTIALLQHLDLVITCESALGHICSIIGKECWIPYSTLGKDYRLGITGEDRLWTPHHRIFLQGQDCSWKPVFSDIKDALREKIRGTDRKA
jgi:hypothetical protein